MARGNRDRILKDVNGNINDHLQNHIHLTNCIHLKNHIHMNSPNLADRALLRDLAVLQKRSKPLRDPSASPPPWNSPSVADLLLERGERDAFVSGRRSVGLEHRRECRRLSKAAVGVGDCSNRVELHERRREESSRMVVRNDLGDPTDSQHFDSRNKKGGYRQNMPLKAQYESDDAALSCNNDPRNNMKREKRRRFRSARRNRPSIATRPSEAQRDMSVSSNSFSQEYDGRNIDGVPDSRCGNPWNWSKIHHRGKSFLDKAGRSLSCGLSESNSKKKGVSDMPVVSETSSSSSSAMSDREALPLLDDPGSRGSFRRSSGLYDNSRELRIFADNLLKHIDSDLASEGRGRLQRQHTERHQNLTQKYIPRTFSDLVGQNLVAQALSNAVAKKKIGLLYVFYGPHGTGKTTCARIFAKALNCQSSEGAKPCGVCDSCIAHDTGKSSNVREISPVSKIDLESVVELLDNMLAYHRRSQYRVLIFDECDTLSSDCWSAILKVIDRAPRHVVFILVCSTLDALPHVLISRCQKFFFNKLKDADIIHTLQLIATREDLEIDKDALKLIASRADGSLRDAEMTLDQLSLLGQKISLCLVQELVGLISDEKLVDLLDSALSADTMKTVKNLRDITESGVEPLTLMSQLATFITDILAGSYDSMRERPKRKFFEQQALTKEDMEKLRQALKTLSEAEKQLRVSNDKMTWLTAAMLQLAPDQQYVPPRISARASVKRSPVVLNDSGLKIRPRKNDGDIRISQAENTKDVHYNHKSEDIGMGGNGYIGSGVVSQQLDSAKNDPIQINKAKLRGTSNRGIQEIWLEVLEKISIKSLKEFMYQEGKLISLSYGAVPTVHLHFNPQLTKSEVEQFRSHIIRAFESVLQSPVTIEIRHGSANDGRAQPILLQAVPPPTDPSVDIRRFQAKDTQSRKANTSEIVEVEASPNKCSKCKNAATSFSDERELGERARSLSLVRGKVSLAHVIQHAEGWSKSRAVSIAEKLEQDNLRLESRSRRLLCCNPSRNSHPKISGLKIRTRKSQAIMKYVSCGRCISGRSSR